MKKNEKIFVGVIALIAIVIIVGLLIARNSRRQQSANAGEDENYVEEEFVQRLEDGTRLNTSEQLQTTKRVEGVEITNIQLTEKDNLSDILATATNVTDQEQQGLLVDVKILDKEGKELTTIRGIIGKLEPGESTEFHANATFDFANAYDFTVTKADDYIE